jgi:predicted nucleic acid-binding protein
VSQRIFLDTSVLVYADDLDAGERRQVAQAILREALVSRTGVISTQVLQEYFAVATRKLGTSPEVARRKVELLATMDVVRIEVPLILAAIDLTRLHSVSFWDALIVRSAASARCTHLITEDLQHGQVLDGVRIESPFVAV